MLYQRFFILSNPARTWSVDFLLLVWKAALIIHNMIVARTRNPETFALPSQGYLWTGENEEFDNVELIISPQAQNFDALSLSDASRTQFILRKWNEVTDVNLHISLRVDLVLHLWDLKSRMQLGL